MASLTLWINFLHVLAALWLAAGAFAGAVVRAQTRRAPELAARVQGLRIAWRLVTVCAIPGSVVAGLLGIVLVFRLGPVSPSGTSSPAVPSGFIGCRIDTGPKSGK